VTLAIESIVLYINPYFRKSVSEIICFQAYREKIGKWWSQGGAKLSISF
tara:strand:- start:78 stop:224 length:147 start_codon:yes stop_codon:yes gene_type:complete